jgi:hypothetical protein
LKESRPSLDFFKCEFDSIEIDQNLQSAKHDEQRISTLRRITIDSSEEYENTDDSTRFNFELDSNEIDESDSHDEKQEVIKN